MACKVKSELLWLTQRSRFGKKSMASENQVSQHNKLIEASHTLTLNEKRLVLLAASKLDPRKPEPRDRFIKIEASEFANVFGLGSGSVYRTLDEALERLYSRNIYIYNKKGEVSEKLRWVYHIKYYDGEGYLEIGFSPTVIPYLTKLHREFTTYQLRQIGSLDSFYAIRIYELCCQFKKKTRRRKIALESLRIMLDMGEKYPQYKIFNHHVLMPSIREINKHTNLHVDVEPTRKGRKVVGFTFHIQDKEENQEVTE